MYWRVRRSGAAAVAGGHEFPLVSAAVRRARLMFRIHLADVGNDDGFCPLPTQLLYETQIQAAPILRLKNFKETIHDHTD
jgi:hypothetical protein